MLHCAALHCGALHCAVLCCGCAVLSCAVLCCGCAVLSCAMLSYAALCYVTNYLCHTHIFTLIYQKQCPLPLCIPATLHAVERDVERDLERDLLDGPNRYGNLKLLQCAPFFQDGAKYGFEMCFDIGSQHLGCWGPKHVSIRPRL